MDDKNTYYYEIVVIPESTGAELIIGAVDSDIFRIVPRTELKIRRRGNGSETII